MATLKPETYKGFVIDFDKSPQNGSIAVRVVNAQFKELLNTSFQFQNKEHALQEVKIVIDKVVSSGDTVQESNREEDINQSRSLDVDNVNESRSLDVDNVNESRSSDVGEIQVLKTVQKKDNNVVRSGTKQIRHLRTSKDGLVFEAGGSIIKNYLKDLLRITHGKQKEFYEWVIRTGKSFEWEEITDPKMRDMLRMYRCGDKSRQCYYNSQLASLNTPLDYYEGWYVTENLPIPLDHGFNIYNGKVVDYTAYGKFKVEEYFGVHVPDNFILSFMDKTGMSDALLGRYYGEVIDN
ncbi:hypothetical protein CMI37_09305 [Candidatus Pacearchaeota archaeon]|nr:hypothetical protein [Candidatus Pacearchaeota archaeon]|tara:strand:+ start:1024 stop:1905 length:882 start_codon:yes stop_codon:yes gene_type:complete